MDGRVDNFTYLMALNLIAGRQLHDPNNHPVMPWVIDFSVPPQAGGWRDLSQTKWEPPSPLSDCTGCWP